jgi:outer membrane protein assembly factor BamB
MRKSGLVPLAALIVAFGIPLFAETADLDPSAPAWPKWRGPNGNGWIEEPSWNPASIQTPKILWKARVGKGYTSVCAVGGYVFTAGKPTTEQETLVCLDGKSGAAVWSFSYDSGNVEYPGSRGTPVYNGDKLYMLSVSGHAYCLEARTGKKLWDTDIAGITGAETPRWAFSSSALIEGNLAVFNVCKSGVALDKETGKIAWKSATTAAGYATPVPFDFKGTRYLAVLGSKTLTVVEALTGKEFAGVPWVTDYDCNVGDPVVVSDTLFVGTDYEKGCALFRIGDRSLTKLWENKAVLPHFSSAVYRDGFFYCNSGFAGRGWGQFCCLDAKNGTIAWKQTLTPGSLLGVGSKLLLTTETGSLIVAQMSSTKFEQIARADNVVPRLCWTAPVLVGGRIYLRSDKGDLICLDVSK